MPSERELEVENEKFFILAGDARNHELADPDYQAFVDEQAKRLVDFDKQRFERRSWLLGKM